VCVGVCCVACVGVCIVYLSLCLWYQCMRVCIWYMRACVWVILCAWMGAWVCVLVFKYMYVCMYVCVYMYVCNCVSIYYVYGYVLQRCGLARVVRTGNRRPGLDPDSCSLWTRYNGNSKTDTWDDPKISTGSCSEDQTTIQIQNYVISCECLLLYYCYLLL